MGLLDEFYTTILKILNTIGIDTKEFHNILPELAKDYAEELGVRDFDDNPDFWIKKYLLEQQAVFGGGRRRKKSRRKKRKSRRKKRKSRRKRKRSRRRR